MMTFFSLISRRYFLHGEIILLSGAIVTQSFSRSSSCDSFKWCGSDSLYSQCSTGISVSFVRLKSTETEVRGDEGVSGVSNERFRNGSGLERTRNGDDGFLKII